MCVCLCVCHRVFLLLPTLAVLDFYLGGRVGLWQKGTNSIIGLATITDCQPFDKSTKEDTFHLHQVPADKYLDSCT